MTKSNDVIVILVLTVSAVIVNLFFTIPLYALVTLHLGQLFAIIALMSRGLPSALIVGLCAGLALYYTTDNPLFLVIGIAELVVMWWLTQRHIPYLVSNLLFWAIIGIPVTWLNIELTVSVPTDFTFIILTKMVLNGVLYTTLAISINTVLPARFKGNHLSPTIQSLVGRIFYLSFLSILMPSMIIAMVFTSRSAVQAEQAIVDDVERKTRNLSNVTYDYIASYVNTVSHFADHLELNSNAGTIQQQLDTLQLSYPGFLTMLLTDSQGNIIAGSPASFYQRLLDSSANTVNVSDRDYFQAPKLSNEVYVSNVFRGRGFGNDPIVAISAPIYIGAKFEGIVEGSLNLPSLGFIEERVELEKFNQAVIVTDRNNQVVFASAKLGLDALERFEAKATDFNIYTTQLALTTLNKTDFLFAREENQFGWKIHVLASPEQISKVFSENLWIFLASLVSVTLLFLLITLRFSRDITQPLTDMAQRMNTNEPIDTNDPNMSVDIQVIAKELEKSRSVMMNFNRELKVQVDDKTKQLKMLNKQLHKLSEEDGLTGLFNRRSFDEKAQNAISENQASSFAFILLDIDNFKNINDTYGHPFGDQCLIALATSFTEHFKMLDALVARYGGEEFAALVFADKKTLEQVLEAFRQDLKTCCSHNGEVVPISVSIGIYYAENSVLRASYQDIVIAADEQLYVTKKSGKDNVSWTG